MRPYLEKAFTKTGLVEWLKVNALHSNPSIEEKKTKTLKWVINKEHQRLDSSFCGLPSPAPWSASEN
jgi:hypothetical protein